MDKKVNVENIYCIKCNKYWKFKNSKVSYIFNKTLIFSFIGNTCADNKEKIFEEVSIEISEILVLINNNNMNEPNTSCTSDFMLYLLMNMKERQK